MISLHGADDAFGRPAAQITDADRAAMPRIVDKRIVEGAGHFLPHEKPEAMATALVDLLRTAKQARETEREASAERRGG